MMVALRRSRSVPKLDIWGLAHVHKILLCDQILRCDRNIEVALKLFNNLLGDEIAAKGLAQDTF